MAGAPNATQVADRWHLLSNLREALVRIANRYPKQLLAAARSLLSQITQTQGHRTKRFFPTTIDGFQTNTDAEVICFETIFPPHRLVDARAG